VLGQYQCRGLAGISTRQSSYLNIRGLVVPEYFFGH
jgi:hypothetical protein